MTHEILRRLKRVMADRAAFNRSLCVKIDQGIWNERRFERIPDSFHETFVADVRGLRQLGMLPTHPGAPR